MDRPGVGGILLGEIHTGLLQHSGALTAETARDLLGLIPQQFVRTWERPIRHAASPEVLRGVDCQLPSASRTRVRAVGTVLAEARVTGDHLVQVASQVWVAPEPARRRAPWSHYLTHPGMVEPLGPVRPADVVDGFLAPGRVDGALDLDGVCTQVLNRVQSSEMLDRRPPFRAARTRLRWAASAPAGPTAAGSPDFTPTPDFTLILEDATGLRTLRLSTTVESAQALAGLCLDVALHDWLVSCVQRLLEMAAIGRRGRAEVLRRLRPAVDYLLHDWMPGARLTDEMAPWWQEVDRRSGMSRQWETAVRRIRDQLTLAAAESALATGARP